MTLATGVLFALVIGLVILVIDLARKLKDLELKSERQLDLLIALADKQGIDPVNPLV